MTDNIQHIDVDSDDFIDAPKALRDYVKKIQAVNTRLTEANAELTGRVTASALTDVLAGFKNPERVKRDLLSDKVDPLDSGAVSKWLESNGDDYAKGTAAPATPTAPAVDPDEIAAHRQINSGEGLRQPADMTKVQAFEAEITKDMTGADIAALARKHGL